MNDKQRDKELIYSLKEGDILYEVSANGFDFDVFAITVIDSIDKEKMIFNGFEKGNPYAIKHEYNIKNLYTKDEVYKYYRIKW